MAIVPLAKVTLYGPADQRDLVLEGLQNLGCMHLVNLRNQPADQTSSADHAPEAVQALKFLRASPTPRRGAATDHGFLLDEVVGSALRIERQQQQLHAEADELKLAIAQTTPWGDFQLPAEDEFAGLHLWFYIIPRDRLAALDQLASPYQIVNQDPRFAYVVVLSSAEPIGMPVPPTRLDERPLSVLRRRLEDVEGELEELHWQRVRLTRWIPQLNRTIGFVEDRRARQRAVEQAWQDPALFAIQGWVPQSQVDQVRAFARQQVLGMTIELPSAEDSPPTLLTNWGILAGGEDAVTFYTTPAYGTWDPSGVVFLSFSVFFAMIMSDAGYAVLLAILLRLFWRRLGQSPSGVRLRKLFVAIAIASIAYGIAVGSYFGFAPPPSSVLDALHVIDATNRTLMMQISIVVGVAHLTLANLALAWSRRWSPIMLSSVGWVAALVGGLAMGLAKSGLQPTMSLMEYGSWVIGAGLLGVLFFSSDRPLFTRNLKDQRQRLVDGVLSLTGISRAFGDVLSYLRLFALGLASTQLATTFNDLTFAASGSTTVGSLLAVIAVACGHGLNFVLAIMSGVVHGLRLNCIEFFGWGLSDEGYPFHPFSKKAT